MRTKHLVLVILIAVTASVSAAYFFAKKFQSKSTVEVVTETKPTSNVSYSASTAGSVDFVEASKKTTPSVVFIKNEAQVARRSSFWFFDFDPFGSIGKVSSSGSGVIISEDGYIVTNNHVIKNAQKLSVVLNNGKKEYPAEVIGTAPSTDLALLKIDAKGLKPVEIANSDEIEIGEWVLAVGNPFNLNSTVTAGIVSAKGRNINIVQNQFPIESFIQTDAAINPGNSGGALVNLKGELVGINTAIASKTGSYVGYGFAIPANIVVKIINDLKEFGQIQRGFDGLEVVDINDEILKKIGDVEDGVFVSRVSEANASSFKRIQTGDIVTAIDGHPIKHKAGYDERLAYYRPGDKLSYTILRDNKETTVEVTLVNKYGTTELKQTTYHYSDVLQAEFEVMGAFELEQYGIDHGLKVTKVDNGRLMKMNIPEGFVFVSLNKFPAKDVKAFLKKLEETKGQIRIEGITPQGGRQYLTYYSY